MTDTITLAQINLNIRVCSECGIAFGVPNSFIEERRKDHNSFYCPNGHSRYFPAKTNEELLKEKLQRSSNELAQAVTAKIQLENQLVKEQRKTNRLQKRVANGVCPCCNRTFKDLANHMQTQHPEFKK